jgi:hypothetical protein
MADLVHAAAARAQQQQQWAASVLAVACYSGFQLCRSQLKRMCLSCLRQARTGVNASAMPLEPTAVSSFTKHAIRSKRLYCEVSVVIVQW